MDLFELFVKLSVDDSDFNYQLKNISGKVSSFGNALVNGMSAALSAITKASAAAATAATTAIAAFSEMSLDSYAEYEQLVGGVETLFGEGADKLQEYAAKAYKTAGLSANAYMETVTGFSASLIQSLKDVGGEIDNLGDTQRQAADIADMALRDMSDNTNKMGSDMSSIQNAYQGFAKQNYTMLDNLKLGYGGTKSEMERLLADAEKLSGIEYDIDSYADIINAIHVIQDDMGITGTTAKEAATTIQGSTGMMKAAWENLVTEFAKSDGDISGAIGKFAESVSTVGDSVIPRVKQILENVGTAITEYMPEIAKIIPTLFNEYFPELVSVGTKMLSSIISGVSESLPQLIETAGTIATEFVTAVMGMTEQLGKAISDSTPVILQAAIDLLNIIVDGIGDNAEIFTGGILQLITSIVDIVSKNSGKILDGGLKIIKGIAQGFTDNFPKMLSAVIDLIGNVGNWIAEHLPEVVEMGLSMLTSLISGIIDNLPKLADTAADIIANLVDYVLEHLPAILDLALEIILTLVDGLTGENLVKIADAAVTLIVKFVETITEHLPEFYEKGYEVLGKLVAGLIEQAPTLIGTAIDMITDLICQLAFNFDWVEIGKDILAGICNGITNSVSMVGDSVKQAGNEIVNGFKDFFGIASPSKLMREKIGKFIPLGIAEGIEDEENSVTKSIASLIDVSSIPVQLTSSLRTPVLDTVSNMPKISKATTLTRQAPMSNSQSIVVNINGIQYQNIDELTEAISQALELQTRRVALSYGMGV